jgi:hypothetical protein
LIGLLFLISFIRKETDTFKKSFFFCCYEQDEKDITIENERKIEEPKPVLVGESNVIGPNFMNTVHTEHITANPEEKKTEPRIVLLNVNKENESLLGSNRNNNSIKTGYQGSEANTMKNSEMTMNPINVNCKKFCDLKLNKS